LAHCFRWRLAGLSLSLELELNSISLSIPKFGIFY
jgi:hypothetical protein